MNIDELLDPSKSSVNNAVRLIHNYQQGKLKPIKTSIDHLNSMLHGGLYPGMIISICARSGSGKTYTAHTLREDILGSHSNVGLLIYNWEMTFFNLLLVEMRKRSNLKYAELLNLKNPTEEQLQMMKDVAESFRNENLTTVSKALNPDEFDKVTRQYIQRNLDKQQLVIIVDHIGITKGSDKGSAITGIMEAENEIKLDYPELVTFINLAQLNRNVDTLFRSADTNPLNLRLSPEMIYMSDSLMQASDLVLGQVIPDKFNMQHYTAVNAERFEHLAPHFTDQTHKKDFTLLKAPNRIYYDYIKPRLEDGQPTLYGNILDPVREEFLQAEEAAAQTTKPDYDIEF